MATEDVTGIRHFGELLLLLLLLLASYGDEVRVDERAGDEGVYICWRERSKLWYRLGYHMALLPTSITPSRYDSLVPDTIRLPF